MARLRTRKNSAAAADPSPLPAERLSELHRLEARLGYCFQDLTLLERSLTHKSFAHLSGALEPDQDRVQDYESLEFLGDAILGFLVSEFLFRTYPSHPEGELSRIKSFLVSTKQLFLLSENLGVGNFVRLSHGEEKTGGRKKKAILADLFESVTAAICLDGGIESAREFVLTQFRSHLQKIAQAQLNFKDHKSTLQEQLHLLGFQEPSYRVVKELGPDHRKRFVIEVRINGKSLAKASGGSKKEAQQKAAQIAIQTLDQIR